MQGGGILEASSPLSSTVPICPRDFRVSVLSQAILYTERLALEPYYLGSNGGLHPSSYDSVLFKLWVVTH